MQYLDVCRVGACELFTRPTGRSKARGIEQYDNIAISHTVPKDTLKVGAVGDAACIEKDVKTRGVQAFIQLNGDGLGIWPGGS